MLKKEKKKNLSNILPTNSVIQSFGHIENKYGLCNLSSIPNACKSKNKGQIFDVSKNVNTSPYDVPTFEF